MDRRVVGRDAAAGRGGVRRFRVVDVPDPAQLADELEPVRDAGEGAQRVGDHSVLDPSGTRGGRRCGCVLAVVRAGDQRLCRQRIVRGELDPRQAGTSGDDRGVRALEDAQLRGAVRIEGGVAVKVVGLEVEEDGDVARELMDVLELEARELADDPGPGLDRGRDADERPADVACDLDGATGGAEDRAEQLGRRRLAVGAGHAEERIAG